MCVTVATESNKHLYYAMYGTSTLFKTKQFSNGHSIRTIIKRIKKALIAMKRTLKLKWGAFKKGIPCNVSCRNEAYFLKMPINASSYVYEDLWNVDTFLMTGDALSILQPDYRPWPEVKEETEESKNNFYKVHDRDKQAIPQYLT
jgi:hypothetical protein